MNSFDAIYKEQLAPVLEDLESKRVKVEKQVIWFRIIFAAILIPILFMFENFAYSFILGFFGFLFFYAGAVIFTHDYTKEFKEKIIKPLLLGFGDTIRYKSNQAIPRFIFNKSNLFGYFNKYSGDDLITGEMDDVKFMLSELHVYEERKSGKHTVIIDVFNGIFTEFEFNKHFDTTLLIYPDVAENYFGSLGKWLQSMNFTKDDLVSMDYPEFEKHFVVYGNDQIEARYLLTHTMMESILKLRRQINVPIYISFSNSKLYIGLEYGGEEHFEPDISTSLFNDKSIKKYFNLMQNLMSIVKIFKLNEYLWSKSPDKDIEIQKQEKPLHVAKDIPEVNAKVTHDEKELHEKYYKLVEPLLKPLEMKRYTTFALQAIFVIVVVFLYGLVYVNTSSSKIGTVIGIGFLVWFGIMYGVYYISSSYNQMYKNQLVKKLITHLNTALTYIPYRRLPQDELYESKLFTDWSSYYGDDYFSGKISGVDVRASEISLDIEGTDIFRGYFFILDLKNFTKKNFRLFPNGYEFDVNDAEKIEFSHINYNLYGNEKDSKIVLNKEFLNNINFINNKLHIRNIYFSYQGDQAYIGFDFGNRSLFDGSTMRSVYTDEDIKYFIEFYKAVENLIESII